MSAAESSPADRLVSQCPRWYELNLHALTFRELWRATESWWQAALAYGYYHLLGGTAAGEPILVPERITIVETVDFADLELPGILRELGFTLAQTFSMPEFTADNITCCFIDRFGTTTCDVVFARVNDEYQSEAIFYSHFGGQPIRSIKSIGRWRADPLERPTEKSVRCTPGDLASRYDAHRQWLLSEPGQPQSLTWERILSMSYDSHQELVRWYSERGVYRVASESAVEGLLRRKGIRWAPRV